MVPLFNLRDYQNYQLPGSGANAGTIIEKSNKMTRLFQVPEDGYTFSNGHTYSMHYASGL